MIQLTQLDIEKHRPGGVEIETRIILVNPQYIVGIVPYKYQRVYANDSTKSIGSEVVFTAESGYEPAYVQETIDELWQKLR